MKIFVINGENPEEKVEIEIEEYSQVRDIKYRFDEIVGGSEKWTKDHYKLIQENIILDDDDFINRYKLREGDEICIAGIETYLRSDDVIIELFLAGCLPEFKWLIVRKNVPIATIRLIIERFQSYIIHMWDCKGNEMQNNQSVTDIDAFGYYRLIVNCGQEADDNLTFDECCNQHDRCKIILYYYSENWWEFEKFSEIARVKIINQIKKIRQIISSNDTIDPRLNENLSHFPKAFVKQNYLFGHDITKRIWDICNEYRKLMKSYPFSLQFCLNDEWHAMKLFFLTALLVTMRKYSDAVQNDPKNTKKSFNDILVDALDCLVRHLMNPCEDWKHAAKRWLNSFFLITRSDGDMDELFVKFDPSMIIVRIKSEEYEMDVELKPKTILEATKAVANKFRRDRQDLYPISHWIPDKPNDGDPYFQPMTFFELMSKMADFENLNELANGGFGKVFICEDKKSGKQVVMKKLIDVKDSLHREILIGSILFDKELIKYSEVIRDEKNIHLTMPYLPGGTLTSNIQQLKCLGENEVVRISHQILTQISELHKSKIIHCDIKPENIVFDNERNVKLIDFGLAKYIGDFRSKDLSRKRKASSPGTINYMAPELTKEDPNSVKIDIWSFGMVMVEMVTGQLPFNVMGPGQILLRLGKLLKYEFKPMMEISNDLKQFISWCLTVDPNVRPTAQQLIESQLINNYLQMTKKYNSNK